MKKQNNFHKYPAGTVRKQPLKQIEKPRKPIVTLETIIQLAINPKPWWLTPKMYQKLIRLILRVDLFKENIKNLEPKNEPTNT